MARIYVTITLDEDIAYKLRIEAAKQRTSRSRLLSRLAEKYLNELRGNEDEKENS